VGSAIHDIHDVPAPLRQEIEHFFQVYKDLEDKATETGGFGNRIEALSILEEARARAREG
jgi:inorganic pyrophosphatase